MSNLVLVHGLVECRYLTVCSSDGVDRETGRREGLGELERLAKGELGKRFDFIDEFECRSAQFDGR